MASNKPLTLKEHITDIIQRYMNENEYDILKVAKTLQIGKSTIYRMLQTGELKSKQEFIEERYSAIQKESLALAKS